MIKIRAKKGLSTIVATILIILITFSAAAVLIAFLKPFVQNNLNGSTECIPYQGYYQFQQNFQNDTSTYNFNCYVQRGNGALISAMIGTGTNLSDNDMNNIKGFLLVFSTPQASESVTLTNGMSVKKTLGGVWRIDDSANPILRINSPNEILTYVYNSSSIYSTIDIYPLLKDGRTCDKADTITLKPCDGISLT